MDTFNPNIAAATQALATAAANDPKPGSVQAVQPDTSGPPGSPLVTLRFTPEFIGDMWKLVDEMTTRTKTEGEKWKSLLKEYLPKVAASGTPEPVNTNSHFRNLHTKLGQLFLQSPEVRVTEQPVSMTDLMKPSPMNPMQMIGLKDIIPVKQTVLNKTLGPMGVDAGALADQLLFDILGWSGICVSKVGHQAVFQTVKRPKMQPNPAAGMPLMPGAPPPEPMIPVLDEMGQPVMEDVPVPIYERDYWRRISPLKVLIDPECLSSRYDEDAGVLGYWFTMKPHQGRTAFKLTPDELKPTQDELRYNHQGEQAGKGSVVMGVELFMKGGFIDPAILYPDNPDAVIHPQKLFQMVLIKGVQDRPVVWRECVDQSWTETGELTDDSIDTFPIRIGTIRDCADTAFPGADAAFTNPLVKARNTGRRQQLAIREQAIAKRVVATESFDENAQAAIKNGQVPDTLEVSKEDLKEGVDKLLAFTEIPKVSADSYRLDADLKQDMDETLGVNANSAGSTNDTVRAATEIAAIQQAVGARNKKEQNRFIQHYLSGVRMLDTLIARYTSQTKYTKITGEDGAARIMAWNGQMVAGQWMYEIAPDSQLAVDTALGRQQMLNYYNLVAKDPLTNRVPILTRLAQTFGMDPVKVVMDPARAIASIQPQHGGPANKHQAEQSGQNSGGPQQGNQRDSLNAEDGGGTDVPGDESGR